MSDKSRTYDNYLASPQASELQQVGEQSGGIPLYNLNLRKRSALADEKPENVALGERAWVSHSKIQNVRDMKQFLQQQQSTLTRPESIYVRGSKKRLRSLRKDQAYFSSKHITDPRFRQKSEEMLSRAPLATEQARTLPSTHQQQTEGPAPQQHVVLDQDYELRYVSYNYVPVVTPASIKNKHKQHSLEQQLRVKPQAELWPAFKQPVFERPPLVRNLRSLRKA